MIKVVKVVCHEVTFRSRVCSFFLGGACKFSKFEVAKFEAPTPSSPICSAATPALLRFGRDMV